MHTPTDPSEWAAASYSPDMASEIDTDADILTEAFARAAARWKGDIPRTVMDFRTVVIAMVRLELENTEGLGGAITAIIASQEDEAKQEGAMQTLALLADSKCAKVQGLIFAGGFNGLQNGESQAQIAEDRGMVRATISKHAKIKEAELSLPPSRGMKTDEAAEAYRQRAHRVHGTQGQILRKELGLFAAMIRRAHRWIERLLPNMTDGEREQVREWVGALRRAV